LTERVHGELRFRHVPPLLVPQRDVPTKTTLSMRTSTCGRY
jgi:hypothetical protein